MYCNCHKSFHQFYVSLARLILKTLLHIEVIAAVEVAVGDGFHDVVGADGDGAVKVANGTFVSINILCCKGAFAF